MIEYQTCNNTPIETLRSVILKNRVKIEKVHFRSLFLPIEK